MEKRFSLLRGIHFVFYFGIMATAVIQAYTGGAASGYSSAVKGGSYGIGAGSGGYTITWQHGPDFGKDTWVASGSGTGKNNGVHNRIEVTGVKRGLIEFDSLSVINRKLVLHAYLRLTLFSNDNVNSDSTLSVYALTRLWTEGSGSYDDGIVSWDSCSVAADNGGSSDSAWINPGGDFVSIPYGTRSIGTAYLPGDTAVFDVTDLVQKWTDGAYNNFGMLIKFTNSSVAGMRKFYSSDYDSVSYRPALTVVYTDYPPIANLRFIDSTYKSVTATWDTTIANGTACDSFALFLASDSLTRYSAFTPDTVATSFDTLTHNRQYTFIVAGFNADTVSAYSNAATVRTDSLYGYRPFGLELLGYQYDRLSFSIIDTSGFVSKKAVFYDSLSSVTGDTLYLGSAVPDTLVDTLDFSGLYDSLAVIKAIVIDTFGYTYAGTSSISLYTPAQRVPPVSVIDTSASLIRFVLSPDLNPGRVMYRIFDAAAGVYISPAGDTSATDTSWHVKTAFDTVTLSVGVNSLHEFFVDSRNSDSVATGYFFKDSLWSWAQAPDIDSIFALSRDSVFFRLDPKSNPWYTYFAVQDSLSGRYIDVAAHRLRSAGAAADSSWAWGTFSEWGAAAGYFVVVEPHTTYVLRAYAKDGNIRE